MNQQVKNKNNLSDIGCASVFPAKPLGFFGDSEVLFMDDDFLAQKVNSLRMHGLRKI